MGTILGHSFWDYANACQRARQKKIDPVAAHQVELDPEVIKAMATYRGKACNAIIIIIIGHGGKFLRHLEPDHEKKDSKKRKTRDKGVLKAEGEKEEDKKEDPDPGVMVVAGNNSEPAIESPQRAPATQTQPSTDSISTKLGKCSLLTQSTSKKRKLCKGPRPPIELVKKLKYDSSSSEQDASVMRFIDDEAAEAKKNLE